MLYEIDCVKLFENGRFLAEWEKIKFKCKANKIETNIIATKREKHTFRKLSTPSNGKKIFRRKGNKTYFAPYGKVPGRCRTL